VISILQNNPPPPYRAPKTLTVSWSNWRKGLNTLLRETEIGGDEVVQGTNLLLIGSGIPTKRWGSTNSFLAGATGYGRFLLPIKDVNDNIQVLAMTDWGILTQQNGASYTTILGASFASGYNTEGSELGGNVYLVNPQRSWTKYDFTKLYNFPTLAVPTGVTVTQLSSASGLNTWSWRVTAISNSGGETTASTFISLASQPQNMTTSLYRLNWTAVSAASGDLTGYNIYRGVIGGETWIGGVQGTTTTFDDYGVPPVSVFRTPPNANGTGGPVAKYIVRFQDRVILAGVPGDPTRVWISGRYPLQEKFDWFSGGGFVKIEPDSGEDITGIAVYYRSATSTQTVVVFKEYSVWEVSLDTVQVGAYLILNPTYRLLTLSQGCTSQRSIVSVENDLMFVNRRGVYILRYEPQLLNVINANELSAKIRPFFLGLSNTDLMNASAIYADKKYVLSFPGSMQHIEFDRERLSFMGPWNTPFGVNKWAKYVDSGGVERWLAADSTDGYVSEFRTNLPDDKGTAMRTLFRSRKEDFGKWEIFKTINIMFMNFRNVQGSVNVNIYLEGRSGAVLLSKAFTITSSTGVSGMGTNEMGLVEMGLSGTNPSISSTELPKKAYLYKIARTFQVEVITTNSLDYYELLQIKAIGLEQAQDSSPSSWVV